mmetsp:Transcript_30097/g.75995  ORF Transcript_30097/g.75995 Transcript_30097/m.75995 type:complete len:232 (+) Transcript_30097:1499-2194(+)
MTPRRLEATPAVMASSSHGHPSPTLRRLHRRPHRRHPCCRQPRRQQRQLCLRQQCRFRQQQRRLRRRHRHCRRQQRRRHHQQPRRRRGPLQRSTIAMEVGPLGPRGPGPSGPGAAATTAVAVTWLQRPRRCLRRRRRRLLPPERVCPRSRTIVTSGSQSGSPIGPTTRRCGAAAIGSAGAPRGLPRPSCLPPPRQAFASRASPSCETPGPQSTGTGAAKREAWRARRPRHR